MGGITWRNVTVTLALLGAAGGAFAQELEPRAYRTLPTGLNFVLVSYSFSSGNVLSDPTIAIEDLQLDVHTTALGYARSLDLFGRSALVSVALPYNYVAGSAVLDGEPVSGSLEGFADSRVKLAINLLGGPAMKAAEFAGYKQRGNFGVSLTVAAPTGAYDSSRLVNIGANRWGAKFEVGYSAIRGKWIFDVAAGAWFFTANRAFEGDSSRRQDPIGSFQAHVSYDFFNGVWLALDANYFSGGRTTVDGAENADLQRSSRWGLTLALPLHRSHSLQLAAHSGAFTRVGADFQVATIAYRYLWPNPRPPR